MNHIHIEKIIQGIYKLCEKNHYNQHAHLFYDLKKVFEDAIEPEQINEPEERYFKLLSQHGYKHTEKGNIYPASHKTYNNWNIEACVRNFPDDWQEVTKQDYLNQELLEDAKRRYPSGTLFIPTARGYRTPEVSTGNLHWCHDRIEEIESGRGIYDQTENKWAEIIEEKKPLFEFEDFKKDLNNLLEKYFCNVK